MKLGKALKMGLAKSIQINDTSEYTIAGVQSYGKGVINRRNEIGKNLKMKKYQVIEPDYLMWCKVDTKNGAFGITKEEHRGSLASTNMALAKIDTEKFNPSFIEKLFSFDFFHKNITHLSSGSTNRKYLTPKQLFEMVEIPAINKNEQDDFILLVDKIERIDLNSELTHQLDLIKQLRQAFLREAMQGKLCHAELVSASQETGHDLLAKIKAEKAQLIAEKKLKKEKELPPITADEIPFEIPEHWTWCRLGEICNTITKGSSPNWQGVQYVDSPEKGILFITSKNVDSFKIDLTKATYVEEKFNEIEPRSILKKGDLLTNIVGASIGRTALYELEEIANINQAVCILRIEHNLINKQFLLNLMNSNFVIELMLKMQFAPGRANLSMGNVANFTIPLPPLHEQDQIVAKLEKLLAFCDGLEQSIKESQGYNEMLLQQVLREALQGEDS